MAAWTRGEIDDAERGKSLKCKLTSVDSPRLKQKGFSRPGANEMPTAWALTRGGQQASLSTAIDAKALAKFPWLQYIMAK